MRRNIIRIDISSSSIKVEENSGAYNNLGGRGLTSAIVKQEVPPLCHPLGAGNKLIIAPGLLSGTNCVNSGRLSIGAKSPLTGTIKESNVGGTAAQSLGKLNIAGIILENKPAGDKLQYILVNKEGAQLLPADDLKGLKNYEVVSRLREKHGEKVSVISIGPAGENCFSSASIAVTDKEGRASRHAGRGGIGAVMGSKGTKAIVIDGTDAPGVEYHDSEAFKEAAKVFRGVIMESDSTKPNTGELAMYSMNAIMAPVNELGAFPTRNFSQGQFEGVEKIDGEALYNTIKERGGIYNHAGCSQCIIQCSNVYVDKEKNFITSALEYETIWALGANCGIDNLDAIAQMDRLCDEYGIDTIETGCAIAVAMEAGVKSFGDYDGAIELIHEIGQGTPMGRILGSGAATTGRAFGVERVPQSKGQSFPAYDPRGLKGLGVTYATSPMGADHTAGFVAMLDEDDRNPEGKAQASLDKQIYMAFVDATGICLAAMDAVTEENGGIDAMSQMVNALFGWNITIENYGKEIIKTERSFNKAAGFTSLHDRLPEFLSKEPLPPHNTVFDVPYNGIDDKFDL